MRIFILIACLLSGNGLLAQVSKIKLQAEPLSVANFHFNKVTVIDNRLDTNVAGWVTKGLDNILVPAVFEEGTSTAVTKFYQNISGGLWQNGKHELVVYITDLFLMEDPDKAGTEGNADIRIQAFVRQGEDYYPVYLLDKQENFEAFDVTGKLFKALSGYLLDVLQNANSFFNPDLTAQKKMNLAEVLASRQAALAANFPLYAGKQLADGGYLTREDFLNGNPTFPITMLEQKIAENLALSKKKRARLFGFVRNGEIHLFTSHKNYDSVKLYRQNGNLFKQDWGLDPKKQATSAGLGWVFGGLAEVVAGEAQNGNRAWYEFVFNPRNGLFYHHKKLAESKEKYEAIKNESSVQSSTGTQ